MQNRVRFRILFYRDKNGRCQACDYVRELNKRHKAKVSNRFKLLAQYGPELPADFGKYLRDGIWELRVVLYRHQHRFLFGYRGDTILVTNAFLKKSRMVPDEEIEQAEKRIADWKERTRDEI